MWSFFWGSNSHSKDEPGSPRARTDSKKSDSPRPLSKSINKQGASTMNSRDEKDKKTQPPAKKYEYTSFPPPGKSQTPPKEELLDESLVTHYRDITPRAS